MIHPAAQSSHTVAESVLDRLPKGDLLLPYQACAISRLMSGVSFLAIEKSRRIGMTWALAAYGVLRAAARPSDGGMNVWYMGYDQEMAKEFIDACGIWARAYGIVADETDEEIIDGDEDRLPALRIRFASGFKIVALPSVPRALRGKQGLVIIDEAAFHNDLAEVLKAAMALLIWGGQVVAVSTHKGAANRFNMLLDEVRANTRQGEVMTVTFNEAIKDVLYERIAKVAQAKGQDILIKSEWIADIYDTYGEDAAEELDCIPAAGAGSWLDPVDLVACEHADAGRPELYSGGLVYIGRDVARRNDLSVIHAYELVGDVLWLRWRWTARGASFAEQDEAFAKVWQAGRIAAAWIDQTGMGEKVVEDLQRQYGSKRIHGEILTSPARLDVATALRERVETGRLRLPPDPDLRADLRSIKRRPTARGGVQLIDGDGMHADEFWAAALAMRAADVPHQEYAYHPVAAPGRNFNRLRRDDPRYAGAFSPPRGLY